MKTKATYRIRNWAEYDTSLRRRRSLTFWISPELLDNWTTKEKTGERGASPKYTAAIETLATVKYLFRHASRQAEGLLASIFELMQVRLPVPDHTTLSRRLARLNVRLPVQAASGARHVVCDSTGVKVYGEGEWKNNGTAETVKDEVEVVMNGRTVKVTRKGAGEVAVPKEFQGDWDGYSPGFIAKKIRQMKLTGMPVLNNP
jgi:hypothetical protein